MAASVRWMGLVFVETGMRVAQPLKGWFCFYGTLYTLGPVPGVYDIRGHNAFFVSEAQYRYIQAFTSTMQGPPRSGTSLPYLRLAVQCLVLTILQDSPNLLPLQMRPSMAVLSTRCSFNPSPQLSLASCNARPTRTHAYSTPATHPCPPSAHSPTQYPPLSHHPATP